MIRLQSFNVFDTLITRSLKQPSDLFILLYRQAVYQGLIVADTMDEDEFMALRRQAERVSRQKTQLHGEQFCTLKQIWLQMSEYHDMFTNPVFPELELTVEQQVLYPISKRFSLIAKARQKGNKICFICDSYLPSDFILDRLIDFGFAQRGDSVFVSSEYGKSMSPSELFSTMFTTLGFEAREVLHHGHNFNTDIKMAKNLGAHTSVIKPPTKTQYSLEASANPHLHRLERSTLCSVLSRQPKTTDAGADEINHLVHHFLGPACTIWAIWILQQAMSKQVQNLYFIARDAYLPYQAAQYFVEKFKLPVKCHYLEVSRNILTPASLYEADSEFILECLFPNWELLDKDRLLSRLDKLGIANHEKVMHWLETVKNPAEISKSDRIELMEVIGSDEVSQLMLNYTSEKRDILCRYLNSLNFFSEGPLFTCDIGWSLRSQSILKKLRDTDNAIVCNLFLAERRVQSSQSGLAISMQGQVPAEDERYKLASDIGAFASLKETIIEHLLSLAPYGTVIGYEQEEDNIRPIYGPLSEEEKERRLKIKDSYKNYLENFGSQLYFSFNNAEQCVAAFRQISDTFITKPPKDSLRALVGATLCERLEDDDPLMILVPYSLNEAMRHLLPIRLTGARPKKTWPSGSKALSSVVSRALLSLRSFLESLADLKNSH
ncbi:MAG: hypothetical protein COA34_007365 [Methylophaga sp.]|uniref:hypothetical protein n=1 Tax=Methylophaga sp. TaxID=2024840 RepID=UPI000C0E17FF|nr:hypothetical protein [Methylophaga sp.]MBL1457675.1 hypothetical protein [Methylophaga sp.]